MSQPVFPFLFISHYRRVKRAFLKDAHAFGLKELKPDIIAPEDQTPESVIRWLEHDFPVKETQQQAYNGMPISDIEMMRQIAFNLFALIDYPDGQKKTHEEINNLMFSMEPLGDRQL